MLVSVEPVLLDPLELVEAEVSLEPPELVEPLDGDWWRWCRSTRRSRRWCRSTRRSEALLSVDPPVEALLSADPPVEALLSVDPPVEALLSVDPPVEALVSVEALAVEALVGTRGIAGRRARVDRSAGVGRAARRPAG